MGFFFRRVRDYWALIKPRPTIMALITVMAGYQIGLRHRPAVSDVLHLALGALLAGAGANAWNQWIEREHDRKMKRTMGRPMASGRMHPAEGALFALVCSAGGWAYLTYVFGMLAAFLAATLLLSYVALYTPLKRVTPWALYVGAVSGALPPTLGYGIARGSLDAGAAVLFAILFLWQIPHFIAIAWIYEEDYRAGGFPMISVTDPKGHRAQVPMAVCGTLLLAAVVAPAWIGMAGSAYLVVALLMGVVFLWMGLDFVQEPSRAKARGVILVSVVYLCALVIMLAADKGGRLSGF
jgi:protoheme IX farnesyltransferase